MHKHTHTIERQCYSWWFILVEFYQGCAQFRERLLIHLVRSLLLSYSVHSSNGWQLIHMENLISDGCESVVTLGYIQIGCVISGILFSFHMFSCSCSLFMRIDDFRFGHTYDDLLYTHKNFLFTNDWMRRKCFLSGSFFPTVPKWVYPFESAECFFWRSLMVFW